MNVIFKHYPVFLSFISFLLSVGLWFGGYKEAGQFVGIWVPSIMAFGIYFKLTIKEAEDE